MAPSDSSLSRRALLVGAGTTAIGAWVVYGASRFVDEQSATTLDPPIHHSEETTGFGVDLAGHPVMGALDAPIDVYYWSDYRCPFCRRFERETLPDLVRNDVEAGRVRIVFIEYPYMGSASMRAAVADRCVWRQVRAESPETYWPWHAAVFDAQSEANSEWASESNLLDIAGGIEGIDRGVLAECLRTNREAIESSIQSDIERAAGLGIRGTPAFVLYHRPSETPGKMVGAQPYEQFEEAFSKLESS